MSSLEALLLENHENECRGHAHASKAHPGEHGQLDFGGVRKSKGKGKGKGSMDRDNNKDSIEC